MQKIKMLLYFYLITILVLCTLIDAHVYSVDCESMDMHKVCVPESEVVIKGANLGTWTSFMPINNQQNIFLTFESGDETEIHAQLGYMDYLYDGPNNVSILSNDATKGNWTGTLMLGFLNGLETQVKHFYNGTTPSDSWITGQSSKVIYNDLIFNITGKFNKSKSYTVLFYTSSDTENINYIEMPVCTVTNIYPDALECKFSNIVHEDWLYSFVVKDNNVNNFVVLLDELDILKVNKVTTTTTTTSSSTTTTSTTEAPYPSDFPIITGVSGSCVDDSINCNNNADLVLTGEGFLNDAADKYKINIQNLIDAGCKIQSITATSVSCNLFGVSGKKGLYPMTLQYETQADTWSKTKKQIGSLVLGEKGTAGFTMNYITPQGKDLPSKKSATVTTALTIVFAILFAIVLIVLLVIFFRFKLINRKTWSTVKKQLQDTQVEELRPRAAVRVEGEAAN